MVNDVSAKKIKDNFFSGKDVNSGGKSYKPD